MLNSYMLNENITLTNEYTKSLENGSNNIPIFFLQDSGATAMHLAAYKKHLGTLEALVASGADVDLVNDLGNTPLHDAVSNGQLLVVGKLVGLGASASKKNRRGDAQALEKTPLLTLLVRFQEFLYNSSDDCGPTTESSWKNSLS
ncbi:serine/threonine-protein phosphatase 6 regulatory ankyrin repeat subunit A-like [Penaeus monodon]|uniref:serine/threonine-protein phosphatase 6 regulatory ankyrin repeat subunit A-like n=1 Tax=Penaeus monodon TaxID=6687 RepID=UPI0018A7D9C3|nr:serine/threonine-protein phosphatase 6 regulatory ankyrin repeat subunit A-like [Penaeus monodon]